MGGIVLQQVRQIVSRHDVAHRAGRGVRVDRQSARQAVVQWNSRADDARDRWRGDVVRTD
jgi:hypothetical protein